MMSHGFPNLFFTGFTQAGLNATNSVTFVSQGRHIGYIVSQALMRSAATVEPSQAAQDDWVRTIRENSNESAKQFAQECTPGYFNNEGEKEFRWYLGEPYGRGFYAFEALLEDWRAEGHLRGLDLSGAPMAVREPVEA
jgi:cyclohexanone monooxygenase